MSGVSDTLNFNLKMFNDKKIFFALTLYLTALFATNTVGIKLMPFIFGTHLSVAIFAFPIVFLMTDVVGEVYGKVVARKFVLMGFTSLVIFLFFNLIANFLPASPDFYQQEAYNQIFGLSLRFTIASLFAYIVGEYQDVLSFFFFIVKISHFYIPSFVFCEDNFFSFLRKTAKDRTIRKVTILPAFSFLPAKRRVLTFSNCG